jgi:hypothetical protein
MSAVGNPEQIVNRRFVLSAVVAAQFIVLAGARAHEWYPLECCAGHDCAPADTVVRRDDGSLLVTARGMSVVIPATYRYWRTSPDGQLHVCIRPFRSGGVMLICAFRGPGA